MKFLSRPATPEAEPLPNTIIGVGSSVRGTLMVPGTLRIDGDFDGDILNCERLEVGQHGTMRADVEVKDAEVYGRVFGNIRAAGSVSLHSGAHLDGDITAGTVTMEPGVYFNGRCNMAIESVEPAARTTDSNRTREYSRG